MSSIGKICDFIISDDLNQSVVIDNEKYSELAVVRFANLFHYNLSRYYEGSCEALERSDLTPLTMKIRTARLLNYLNQSSELLQKLTDQIKGKKPSSYIKVKKLINYLHRQIDGLRISAMRLLKSRYAVKNQFTGINKKVNSCICL